MKPCGVSGQFEVSGTKLKRLRRDNRRPEGGAKVLLSISQTEPQGRMMLGWLGLRDDSGGVLGVKGERQVCHSLAGFLKALWLTGGRVGKKAKKGKVDKESNHCQSC